MSMQVKFSPSVNIIRDSERRINYIVTPNSTNTIKQIINDFNEGIRSNIIIGSYGSGKSSLLWAFEQSLKGEGKYFNVSDLGCKPQNIKFLRFVGEYDSIIESFKEQLNVKKVSSGNQQIFDAIYQQFDPVKKKEFLVIIIDEFGKYLEFASKNNSEKELYFIQQLAEFCNHPDRNILFITTLHQNFEAYSYGLSESQRNEWAKVKGRLKEITFNEPVEQLLLLASDFIKGHPGKAEQKQFLEINELVNKYKLFSINKDFIHSLGFKTYPLDFISGYCLTLALQKNGQNERSLFTFLESREFKNIIGEKNPKITLAWLHDYLWSNYYSYLNSKYNSSFNSWADIKDSIERTESVIQDNTEDAIIIVKVIGILNLFTSKGARINKDFLVKYLHDFCGVKNVEIIIEKLVRNKIIIHSKFNDSFRLFQGTDIDIDQALINAEKEVEKIKDVANSINKHFGQLPIITAKEISYKTGTPRNFRFIVSETPQFLKAEGEVDGFINLIINEKLNENLVIEHSKIDMEPNVYGIFRNSKAIKKILFDIEKANKVKTQNLDDKIVVKEMDNILTSYKALLNHYFIDAIFTDGVDWYFKGNKQVIINKKYFNQFLSVSAYKIYNKSPIFKNELVNRNKISSSIHTARKDFFTHLVNNWMDKDLNYDENFPPDKTIYISLLRENGMHKKVKGSFELVAPGEDSSFYSVWNACENFLNSTKQEKKPISELYNLLLNKPYKLKLGLAEFWIPIFLFIKRNDFALFGENGYIPEINESILGLFARNQDEYKIKAFDLEGVKLDLFNKYREILNQSQTSTPNNKSFIESIRPFLVFYKQLPEYSQKTKRLSKEAISIRNSIISSTEPERTFFEDFPKALYTTVKELTQSKEALQIYSTNLQIAINEIRTSYEELINRFERFIFKEIVGDEMPFEEYKVQLQLRFKNVKEYLMLNDQKVFHQRINSPLEERKTWLSSLAQVLMNKSLESINDEEEKILYEKFKNIIHELDNLVDISKSKYDVAKEKIFKFELSGDKLNIKTIVKIPKSKFNELEDTEKQINKILKKDKQLNIAVLTKILQDILKNEKS